MKEDYDASQDPNYVDKLLIGYITFPDDISENLVGKTNFRKSIGECKIEVYGGEGNIPHFHINNLDGTFQSCICIYSNNYFSHGGKYTGTFNSSQCKILDDWLSSYDKLLPSYTNWEIISALWEKANPDCKFPNKRKVKSKPNYSIMINFKDC